MDIVDVVRSTVQSLENGRFDYFITGSFASTVFGESRTTFDIDIVIRLTPDGLARFMAMFPDEEFYLSADAARDAVDQQTQFNIIHHETGLKIDLYPRRGGELVDEQFQRKIRIEREGAYTANFISPEDVILNKMDFFRLGQSDRQFRDVVGIVKRMRDHLDVAYIEHWAGRLGLLSIWKSAVERAASKPG